MRSSIESFSLIQLNSALDTVNILSLSLHQLICIILLSNFPGHSGLGIALSVCTESVTDWLFISSKRNERSTVRKF